MEKAEGNLLAKSEKKKKKMTIVEAGLGLATVKSEPHPQENI